MFRARYFTCIVIVWSGLVQADTITVGQGGPGGGYDNAPVADAGLPRYAAQDPVVLDGTGSFDPDGYGELSYEWLQISGPTVGITDADTATPTVSGFAQTNEIQECEFELIVSDGDANSSPDTVKIIIVPDTGDGSLMIGGIEFDPDKPTIVYFGGGNGSDGSSYIWGGEWSEKANFIIPIGSGQYDGYSPPYERWGDKLIVYLSSVAPNYNQAIQTSGYSTGGNPSSTVGAYLNTTYADKRYNVNRVTFLDGCVYSPSVVHIFIGSSVDGEQCWLDSYRSGSGSFCPGPEIYGALNVYFPSGNHGTPGNWYRASLDPSVWDTDIYNHGITAGAYFSVIGPGKNLQLARGETKYHFNWVGPNYGPGYFDFYNESLYPGRLPEPVTLLGPADGNTVDANGAVLSCQLSENAVGYQLLFGPEPYHMDYLISDTVDPPTEVISTFPFEETCWTLRAYDQYGSTIYADPVCIKPQKTSPPIGNTTDQQYLAFVGYELISEKRLSRTEFEYCFRMKVKNMSSSDVENIIIELISTPASITVLDSKVGFSSIHVHQEVLSDDTFIVRIDRSFPLGENALIWEISESSYGDYSDDGQVNLVDFAILASQWRHWPGIPSADMAPPWGDAIVDTKDLDFLLQNWLYAPSLLWEDLISYWNFDEDIGNIAVDSVGSNDGTVYGALWTSGKVEGALSFDGNGDYVEISDEPFDFGSNRNFSICLWLKTTSTAYMRVLDKSMAGTSPYTGWSVYISANTGQVSIWIKDDADKAKATTTTNCADGNWHFITAVADRDGNLKIYHNGNLEDTDSLVLVGNIDNNIALAIGRTMDYYSQQFNGAIDEVTIFGRVLTVEEIQMLYLQGSN